MKRNLSAQIVRTVLVAFIFSSIVVNAGCASTARDVHTKTNTKRLTNISTLESLLACNYDGEVTLGEMLEHGNFGLGTYDGLDGEMIVLDGVVYQARVDGTVATPGPEVTTPFACVCNFSDPQHQKALHHATKAKVEGVVDQLEPDQSLIIAARLDGEFEYLKARSVVKQTKPYPPLAEVVKTQTIFEFNDIDGSLVGYRCPTSISKLNVAGFHWHFISTDRQHGGHVLAFTLKRGTLSTQVLDEMLLLLCEDTAVEPAKQAGSGYDQQVQQLENLGGQPSQ